MLLFRNRNHTSAADLHRRELNGNIYSEDEFRGIIEKERARADRTDIHFSLILLDLGSPAENHETRHILQRISARMRKIDEIGWYDRNLIGIVLPNTSSQGAHAFIESLSGSGMLPLAKYLLKVYTYDSEKVAK